jgi:hypothetical protein
MRATLPAVVKTSFKHSAYDTMALQGNEENGSDGRGKCCGTKQKPTRHVAYQ